jgi:sigma-B regulation protein RsbU (phosphoserine phosphatase)
VSKTRSFLNFSRKSAEADTLKQELTRLRRSVHELKILSDLAFAIGGSSEPEEIVETLVDRLMHAVEAEQAVVTLLDQDEEDPAKTSIRLRATSAVDNVFRLSDSILGWMYLHKQALVVNDPKTDERFKRVPWDEAIRSIMCVPLLVKSNLTGLITIYNKKVGPGFTEDDQRLLTIIAAQSAQLIENAKLYQESLKLAQVREQQKNAYEIQRNLLPSSNPEVDGYDIAGASTPAQTVGGDYFDFIKMIGDRWGVCLGDVSGKGIPAALLMANLQATLRGQVFSDVTVDELVDRSNKMMYANMDDERFVTLFYGRIDPQSHELSYCNAGHEPPLLFTTDGELTRLATTGIALGVLDAAIYKEQSITMRPGDLLVIYSDGVPDATNASNEMFGSERFESVIREHRDKPAAELTESITKAVREFVGNAPQFDDLTLIVVKRDP